MNSVVEYGASQQREVKHRHPMLAAHGAARLHSPKPIGGCGGQLSKLTRPCHIAEVDKRHPMPTNAHRNGASRSGYPTRGFSSRLPHRTETPLAIAGFRGPRGPISRILSPGFRRGGGHLSSPSVTGRIMQPTRGRGGHRFPTDRDAPLFGLAPGGVFQHPDSHRDLVRSYRTVSPLPVSLPRGTDHRRFGLCGTFRRLATPGGYPAPCPVESGLSSPTDRGDHLALLARQQYSPH